MITEAILKVFMSVSAFFINLLPDFTFELPENVLSGLNKLASNVGFFLPVGGLSIIFTIWLSYNAFRIFCAIIIRLFKTLGKG